MEPAQKRQRTAATTMQRISLLPKEVQAGILAWAMEPTPTAVIMKAAIGNAYGESGWWLARVNGDRGFQKHLNCHSPCEVLWARVLTQRRNGTLAWKWSQTNGFMNLTCHIHKRGVWAELRNEWALRRELAGRKRIPYDYDVYSGGFARSLYVKLPDGRLKATGACVDGALSKTTLRMSTSVIFLRNWWSPQMAWYAEHRWVNGNEQARDDVEFARSSYQ